MPNIAVLVGVLYTVKNLFDCIKLVRSQDHQTFVAFVQNDVFAYHFAQITLLQERASEHSEVIKRHILCIRPVESEFISAIGIVGKVTRINSVANDKQLDIVEQAMKRCLVISLNLIICFFQFYSTTFQLNLNQR